MKTRKNIIKVIIIFTTTLIISIFINKIKFDEIWNYGFSYNISNGLIPYKDFNMLQTPLYFFLGSIFIKIIGNYLISINILNSIIITITIIMSSKYISKKIFIIYPIFLYYTIPSYNSLCLLYIVVILYLLTTNNNNKLIGLLIGLAFITKQTIGICLLIPYLYYSKNKLKSISIFLLPFLFLTIYLIQNEIFTNFINYCFLGMLDFANKNTVIGLYFIIPVIIDLIIIVLLIKNKFENKELFYILAFEVIAFPLNAKYQFVIGLIPIIIYIIKQINNKYILISIGIIIYYIFILITYQNITTTNLITDNNFASLRKINNILYNNIIERSIIIKKNNNKNTKIFIISPDSYFIKLYSNIEINNYDLLLKGNIGYQGEKRIIKEINKTCKNNKCNFYLIKNINFHNNQFSKEIYDYISNKYKYKNTDTYFINYTNYN